MPAEKRPGQRSDLYGESSDFPGGREWKPLRSLRSLYGEKYADGSPFPEYCLNLAPDSAGLLLNICSSGKPDPETVPKYAALLELEEIRMLTGGKPGRSRILLIRIREKTAFMSFFMRSI